MTCETSTTEVSLSAYLTTHDTEYVDAVLEFSASEYDVDVAESTASLSFERHVAEVCI